MTLVKRTNNLFPSVPSFFDDFFVKDLMGWSNTNSNYGTSLPAVNIIEDENGFNVEVAAPGLSKDDFKVEVENDVLTISSEKVKASYENGVLNISLPKREEVKPRPAKTIKIG